MVLDSARAHAIASTLTARYALLWDDRRYDEWILLFVEGARFDWRGKIYDGREAIQRGIGSGNRARPAGPGLHAMANTIALADGDGSIKASSDFQYISPRDGHNECLFAGRLFDSIVVTSDGWRFSSRCVRFLGDSGPDNWIRPWPPHDSNL
jgi:3-phenylpropionate/cinnamic acid dioxygenase small subunit